MTQRLFGLISDTHGYVHPALFGALEGVEAILHAGDVCGEHVFTELETIAPVLAVRGNCDMPDGRLPEARRVELPGGEAILTHGHLLDGATTDPIRFLDAFAKNKPRLILFGHSHRWFCQEWKGVWVVNPGSAGRPRFSDKPSAAILVCEEAEWRIRRIDLPWPPGGVIR